VYDCTSIVGHSSRGISLTNYKHCIYSKMSPTFETHTCRPFYPLVLSSSPTTAPSTTTTTSHGPGGGCIGRGRRRLLFLFGGGRVIDQEGIQIERFGQNPRAHGGSPYTQRGARDGILAATICVRVCVCVCTCFLGVMNMTQDVCVLGGNEHGAKVIGKKRQGYIKRQSQKHGESRMRCRYRRKE
jgi:hypothetical protein